MTDRECLLRICEIFMEPKFDMMTQHKVIRELVYLWTLDSKEKAPSIKQLMEKIL